MEIIDGYDGIYEIHLNGPGGQPGVWSNYKKDYLSNRNRNRYHSVILYKNGKPTSFSIHRIVALYFINNPDNLPLVDHIDRNRTNNNVQNLRWVSGTKNTLNQSCKGYYWRPDRNRFEVSIRKNGKRIWLGHFKTEDEAKEQAKKFRENILNLES